MPVFLLPDLGEGLTEVEVVSWLVAEGDTVVIDQPVVEVETAKATVEVPVPFAGVVSRRHGAPGDTITVGDPLIEVADADADADADAQPPRDDTAPAGEGFREPGAVTAEGGEETSGNVLIGYGTSAAPRRRRAGRRAPTGQPGAAPEPAAQPAPAAGAGAPAEASTALAVISPLVRRLARDRGIDLTRLTASGPRGIIARRDVEQAIAVGPEATASASTAAAEAGEPPIGISPTDGVGQPGTQRIPLKGLRKTVADKLSRSRREIPEATVWVDVDATELVAARRALNARQPDRPVSLLALIARFTVLGLRRYPELNARVEADAIVLSDAVHLGFAAQTDRGLVVPVVRDAQRLTTRELSAALAERIDRGRHGQLSPTDLTGGTFTVNNYGVFGVDGSAAIINHPEVAILGMGRIIDRPWVIDGQVVVRSISQLTLAFDHRVCDGGTAGGFLRFVADCVESPVHALGDL